MKTTISLPAEFDRKPKTISILFSAMLAFTVFACVGLANAQEVRSVNGVTVLTVQNTPIAVDFVPRQWNLWVTGGVQ